MYRKLLTSVIYFLILILCFSSFSEIKAQKKISSKAKKVATLGDTYFQKKDYRNAVNKYAEAIMMEPEYSYARFWKGYAHYYLNEFELAIEELDKSLSQGHKPLDVYKLRWYLNLQQKNYDAALADAQKGVELEPTNALICFGIGDIYHEKGEYQQAIDAYEKALKLNPNNGDAIYNLAVDYSKLENYPKQGEMASLAINKGTKFAGESYFLVADALNRSKKTDEAIEYYRKAIETKPDLYGPYPALSDLYRVDNRFEEAIQIANQGLRYYPMDSNLFTSLSWYYSLADKPIEAINSAKAAINLAPDQYMGYTNLCRAYNDAKQPQQAIAACSEALKLRPNDGETHLYIGRAYEANGKEAARAREHYRKAVAGLEQFTQENPDYSDGFYLLGNAYFLVERDDKAIEAYKRCLQLAPRFARARYTIGVAYLAKGDKSAARAQYDILKDIDNNWAARLLEQMNGK